MYDEVAKSSESSESEQFKRMIKFDEETGKYMDGTTEYVPIPMAFADNLVRMMRNGSIYENIINFNGQDMLEKKKYEAYQEIAKVLGRTKYY